MQKFFTFHSRTSALPKCNYTRRKGSRPNSPALCHSVQNFVISSLHLHFPPSHIHNPTRISPNQPALSLFNKVNLVCFLHFINPILWRHSTPRSLFRQYHFFNFYLFGCLESVEIYSAWQIRSIKRNCVFPFCLAPIN